VGPLHAGRLGDVHRPEGQALHHARGKRLGNKDRYGLSAISVLTQTPVRPLQEDKVPIVLEYLQEALVGHA
jgi:hypothetical protein